ncbi:hypothetical protein R6Q59_020033 [Mikania micrantha]
MEDQIMEKKNRIRHGISRSLSNLEFEELKGFMDMGLCCLNKIKIQAWLKSYLGFKD